MHKNKNAFIDDVDTSDFINKFYWSRNSFIDVSKMMLINPIFFKALKWFRLCELEECLDKMILNTEYKLHNFGIDTVLEVIRETQSYRDRKFQETQEENKRLKQDKEGMRQLGNAVFNGDKSSLSEQSKETFERAKKEYIKNNPDGLFDEKGELRLPPVKEDRKI